VLSHTLRQYRRDRRLAAALELPWRPLYEALKAQCGDDRLPEIKGARDRDGFFEGGRGLG
jgi:hypothetical protein